MVSESIKTAVVNKNNESDKNKTANKDIDSDIHTTKIIRTIESFYPVMSGPANQAFMISSLLEKKKIKSPIYTSNLGAKNSPIFEIYKGVSVNRFKINFGFMKYCITPKLKYILEKENFDIIHAHNYRNYQADVAFKIAKKLKKPFVINVHGALLGYENFVYGINQLPYKAYDWFTQKKVVLRADKVIVSSMIEIDEAKRFGVPDDKIAMIPMGINVPNYFSLRTEKEQLTALFVGRISRNRNLEPIIKAMRSVDKRIRLRIVGEEAKSSSAAKSGYLDELKQLAKKLKLENVEFTGPKYGEELILEYKNADLFVYTSLSENFGQTILEAAASGLPVICTPVGVANEIVNNNETGIIVDYHDEERIADAINSLLEYKKRAVYGNNIKGLVKKNYNWDGIIRQYEVLYDQLIH